MSFGKQWAAMSQVLPWWATRQACRTKLEPLAHGPRMDGWMNTSTCYHPPPCAPMSSKKDTMKLSISRLGTHQSLESWLQISCHDSPLICPFDLARLNLPLKVHEAHYGAQGVIRRGLRWFLYKLSWSFKIDLIEKYPFIKCLVSIGTCIYANWIVKIP